MALDPTEALARQLAKIEKAQRDKGSTPQLGRSSIEDGKVEEYDASGQLKQVIGKQPDGTNTVVQVNGPTPPPPSAPQVTASVEAARIYWDGTWLGGSVAPLDLARIDVHLVTNPAVNPLITPSVATISAGSWGEANIPVVAGSYYAYFVAWTTSGKSAQSPPSGQFTVQEYVAPVTTDGNPPSDPPTLQIFTTVGAMLLKIEPPANPDPILTYRIYINGELASEDPATMISVSVDADGTRLPFASDTEIRVSAVDGDGEGPLSAAMLGRPIRIVGSDITPGAITSTQISDFAIPVTKLHSLTHVIY